MKLFRLLLSALGGNGMQRLPLLKVAVPPETNSEVKKFGWTETASCAHSRCLSKMRRCSFERGPNVDCSPSRSPSEVCLTSGFAD